MQTAVRYLFVSVTLICSGIKYAFVVVERSR